jgi:hypothetical protein
MLADAPEIKATRTWTGLAYTGRVALSHPDDTAEVAVRVLGDPAAWGQRHELTGPRPLSWPEALRVLSDELGETVTFRVTDAFGLVQHLVKAGTAPGMAELLVTREWAIMAGENERTTALWRPQAYGGSSACPRWRESAGPWPAAVVPAGDPALPAQAVPGHAPDGGDRAGEPSGLDPDPRSVPGGPARARTVPVEDGRNPAGGWRIARADLAGLLLY